VAARAEGMINGIGRNPTSSWVVLARAGKSDDAFAVQ